MLLSDSSKTASTGILILFESRKAYMKQPNCFVVSLRTKKLENTFQLCRPIHANVKLRKGYYFINSKHSTSPGGRGRG